MSMPNNYLKQEIYLDNNFYHRCRRTRQKFRIALYVFYHQKSSRTRAFIQKYVNVKIFMKNPQESAGLVIIL